MQCSAGYYGEGGRRDKERGGQRERGNGGGKIIYEIMGAAAATEDGGGGGGIIERERGEGEASLAGSSFNGLMTKKKAAHKCTHTQTHTLYTLRPEKAVLVRPCPCDIWCPKSGDTTHIA